MTDIARNRIKYLDGLRGVAILGVLLFHAYVSDPSHLPFGERYGFVPIRLGWVGVQLFFMISGFVILMTIERCHGIVEFLARRWFRLFPAMLISSVIILGFDFTVGEGPYVQRTWINLLPGLMFVSPSLIHTITGKVIDSMDVTFWSLYVEVVFYLTFGAAYFILGATRAIGAIFGIFIATILANIAVRGGLGGSFFSRCVAAADWLGFIHFGWFASGTLFFRFSKNRDWLVFCSAVFVGAFSAITAHYPMPETVALLVVVAIFSSAIRSNYFQAVLSIKFMLFFGYVSYALYLVHNNILIGMMNILARMMPELPSLLIPIAPLASVMLAAWIITAYGEPAIRSLLWRNITRTQALLSQQD
jgi:peptidoglycan/LPS O-acetylase OafA/YrhL